MRQGALSKHVVRWRLSQRCALAGDQVGQGYAVGCDAGKLCKLVDTVLKGVYKRQLCTADRNT